MTAIPQPSRPAFHRFLRTAAFRLLRLLRTGGNASDAAGRRKALLFLQYDPALGSVVNATPIFAAVKKANPAAHVTVAASGVSLEVLRHNPFIDRLIPTPDPHEAPLAAARALLSALMRTESFDAVLTDAGNMKARIGLLALLARARARIGFTTSPELYDLALTRDAGRSMREEHFRLAAALGASLPPGEPRLYFTGEEAEMAARLLGEESASRRRIAFVTQTSGGQPTRWFDDRFAAVADHLAESVDAALYFLGGAKEAQAIDRIRGLMRHDSVNLAGRTGIGSLAALLCQCDLVVSLDTGTLHVARAAGVPTVAIAAAWQPAHEWLPLGVPQIAIVRRDDIACRECRKITCASHECMDEIAPATVIAAIETLWETYPPAEAARRARTERGLVSRQEGAI